MKSVVSAFKCVLMCLVLLCQSSCSILDAISESADTSSFRFPLYQGEFIGEVVSVPIHLGRESNDAVVGIRVTARPSNIEDYGTSPDPKRLTAEQHAKMFIDGTFDKADIFLWETPDGQLLDATKFDSEKVTFRGRLRQGYELHQSELGRVENGEEEGGVARDASIIVLDGLGPLDEVVLPEGRNGVQ